MLADVGAETDELTGHGVFGLPLVSIVITAFNYGRYLEAALASVLGQSYEEVECIVVDDGSTDETPLILARMTAAHRRIRSIRNPAPTGQGAATRVGFEACQGQFVVLMDADDVLTPDFVRDHVYVNLSSRIPVGCTSSDIYQVVGGRLALAAGEALNRRLLRSPAGSPAAMRPLAAAPDGPWPHRGPGEEVLRGLCHVPPGETRWCWSPTTGNMFRRDALALLIGFDEFDRMRGSADVFVCAGVSVLCGSLLIDKPLSWYRIHGTNMGSFQAQLTNVRSVRESAEQSRLAKAMLIQHFTRNAVTIRARLWGPEPLLDALRALAADPEGPGDAYLSECLERYRQAMIDAVGEPRLNSLRPPPVEPQEAAAAAPPEAVPAPPPSRGWWRGSNRTGR
jgi:hypothetical protein